jgi:hypothetical protein
VHIEVTYLLLGIDRHILTLLNSNLFVNFKNTLIIKVHLDIFERKHGFHGHEKRDASLDGEAILGVGQLVLQQELIELTDLLATERQDVDQR